MIQDGAAHPQFPGGNGRRLDEEMFAFNYELSSNHS
jgi:hypothetical protein